MGGGPRLGAGVGHGHGQTADAQRRHVRQIVADVAHRLRRHAGVGQQAPIGRQFVRRSLHDEADAQLRRAASTTGERRPVMNGRALAGPMPDLQAGAVADVKLLVFQCPAMPP